MAGKISVVMDVAKRSMMNSQNQLSTVAHNIASKNVEGYSRQRAETATNPTINEGKLQFGTGARTVAVTRNNNPWLEKQIQVEEGKLGTGKGMTESLARVENVFNDQNRKGLNQFVTEFFNAFRELANTPDSQATRDVVKQTAEAVTSDFKRVDSQLKTIQHDIDVQAKAQVDQINSMVQEVAGLNNLIEKNEFTGASANDERDRRDQLIKDLGKIVNIHYSEGEHGKVNVVLGNNAILVSGGEFASLTASPAGERGIKRDSNVEIVYEYAKTPPTVITDQVTGGELGGALEVRDKVINKLSDRIDALAHEIGSRVNQAHARGFDRYGNTNVEFFDMAGPVRGTAATMKLNGDIAEDVWRIGAGAAPNAPGDNRIANLVSSLQFERWMGDGSSTFNDYYNGIVSEMAVHTKHQNSMYEHQENVVKQMKNVRENISGVNLDEEAVKMIEHQKMFDASAKTIRVADEMLQTVLDLKR